MSVVLNVLQFIKTMSGLLRRDNRCHETDFTLEPFLAAACLQKHHKHR